MKEAYAATAEAEAEAHTTMIMKSIWRTLEISKGIWK